MGGGSELEMMLQALLAPQQSNTPGPVALVATDTPTIAPLTDSVSDTLPDPCTWGTFRWGEAYWNASN